jgi:hypothetical protein
MEVPERYLVNLRDGLGRNRAYSEKEILLRLHLFCPRQRELRLPFSTTVGSRR